MGWMKEIFKIRLGLAFKGLIGMLLFLGLILGLSTHSFGQISHNVALVGKLVIPGGMLKDVFVRGDYAYVAARGIFSIVDISNPKVPKEIGFYDTPGPNLYP